MPNRRRIDAEHPGYDPSAVDEEGRAQCRRCLAPLTRPGTPFCSAACAHDFRVRSSPAYARVAVFARDHGVCTHCRLDCGLLDRVIARLRHGGASAPVARRDELTGDRIEPTEHEEGVRTALWLIEQLGLGRRRRLCSLWQMDHRVPFSTGGADCGLGNLRTLCLACHRLQTRDLHRRERARRVEERG